jgi:hypothetical protein
VTIGTVCGGGNVAGGVVGKTCGTTGTAAGRAVVDDTVRGSVVVAAGVVMRRFRRTEVVVRCERFVDGGETEVGASLAR